MKSHNLFKISRTPFIWNIPYSVYYMSCNLEHVLFNRLNCTDEEKEDLSYKFAVKYKNKIKEFIESNNNSLKRYTNFSLCLETKNDN